MDHSATEFVRGGNMKRSGEKKTLTCAVCGDKARGYNYGALTCEGCKRFFRLTDLKKTKLVCLNNFTCEVTKETRTNCRPCRFQACLNAGMKLLNVERDDLEDTGPPKKKKKKKNKVSSGMDLINILLDAPETTTITSSDLLCERTTSGLLDTDEMGENGRAWAARFVSTILDSCGNQFERTDADQEMVVLDIMTMRLAASFVPELKGFLFQSGSLVSLSDIAKRLRRKLCRRLFYMASLLICMGVDDHEVSLLCGILATLSRPSQYGGRASPLLDDLLKSQITTLHQYELNKRSWKSNMSYKMLQALLNVHEISIKEDGGLFVWSCLQENETIQKKGTGLTPSPEAANILAMELLQGLVSSQSPAQSDIVQKRIPSPDFGSYLSSSAIFQPHQDVISLDVSHGPGFSNGRMTDKHIGDFKNSFQIDFSTLHPNNIPSIHNIYLSHQQPGSSSDLPSVSYDTDHSLTGIHRYLPPDTQYIHPSDLYNQIYSSCKQQLSQLEHPPLKSCCNSDVQDRGTLQSNTKYNTKKPLDPKPSYTSFMIGQHPAFLSDK